MKNLATALFVIFTVLLTTQFLHHGYVRIFYGQESIIDQPGKKKKDITLDDSLSMKELSMIYADAVKRIKLYEEGKGSRKASRYESSEDPYKRKAKIEEIITSRESDYRSAREILFFWITGLLLVAGGSAVFIKLETWTGAALVTAGFLQMTWITGPLFFISADVPVSSMVINIKLILSCLTIAGVIAFNHFTKKYTGR